jgi:hypothetical protein
VRVLTCHDSAVGGQSASASNRDLLDLVECDLTAYDAVEAVDVLRDALVFRRSMKALEN